MDKSLILIVTLLAVCACKPSTDPTIVNGGILDGRTSNDFNYVFAGFQFGVWRSSDTGKTWYQSLPDSVQKANIASNSSSVFASGFHGLWKSNDNGTTWARLNVDPQCLGLYVSDNVLLVGTGVNGIASEGIRRSTDGGILWSRVSSLVSPRCFAKHHSYLFAGGSYGGIRRSSDDGETWIEVNGGLDTTDEYNGFASVDSTLYVVRSAGVYQTTDDGMMWSAIDTDIHYYSCITSRDQDIFIGSSDGVFQSSGSTFSPTLLLKDGCYSLGVKGNIIFAGMAGTIKHSTDGGSHWQIYDSLTNHGEVYSIGFK
jgi:photosystem II stability/assembly factor-like uncharacterized protein